MTEKASTRNASGRITAQHTKKERTTRYSEGLVMVTCDGPSIAGYYLLNSEEVRNQFSFRHSIDDYVMILVSLTHAVK